MTNNNILDEKIRLKVRMAERGLLQKDLVAATGISKTIVSQVINGLNKSPWHKAKIYKFLDLELPEEVY